MLEPNFTLYCSDDLSIKVSKEQLCASFPVFLDILGMEPGDNDQSCQIAESSTCVTAVQEFLKGNISERSVTELVELALFAKKYQNPMIEVFARTQIREKVNHPLSVRESLECAAHLGDVQTVIEALHVLSEWRFDVNRLDISQEWKVKCSTYLKALKLELFDHLHSMISLGKGEPPLPCDHCFSRSDSFGLAIFTVINAKPGASAEEILSKTGYGKSPRDCDKCHRSVDWIFAEWDTKMKEIQTKLAAQVF